MNTQTTLSIIRRTALAAVLLAGAAFPARALSITSSFTSPLVLTDLNESGTLALFDTQLGTLTGAVLSINGALESSITLINQGMTTPAKVRASAVFMMGFSSSNGSVAALFNGYDDLSYTMNTGVQTLAANGGSYTQSFSLAATQQTSSYDLSSMLAELGAAGGGGFTVGCMTESGTAVSGGGGAIDVIQSTHGLCGASITYTYEAHSAPVPEPGSLAMLSAGLLAVGSVYARRKPGAADKRP